MNVLNNYAERFAAGLQLDQSDAEPLLDELIASTDEPLLAQVFRAWNSKGISEDEIFYIARIMRDRCTRISSSHETIIDIVGTGGGRAKTFNVSTAAAFVVAGAGVPVAKHGNKAATSNTGSADVLDALGIRPDIAPSRAEKCLDEIGICFMFAPNFHRLSPTLAKVRRGLGFPTIFNCVGPLCNPAGAQYQLVGVWSPELVRIIGGALQRLGTTRSWVVHGEGGLDEVSVTGTTSVAEATSDAVRTFELSLNAGGGTGDSFAVGSADESARIIRSVLSGELAGSFAEEMVVVNAAAALHIAGRAGDVEAGRHIALESIKSGAAMRKLASLAEAVA